MAERKMTAREEVVELLASYCLAIDDRRLNDLWPLFSADCELILRDGVIARGRDEIRDILGPMAEHAIRHRHIVTSSSIQVDGDTARARSDWYLMMPSTDDGWVVEGAGSYHDAMRREAGGWLFTRREIRSAPR